jgi:2-polyprenyl-6-methoxyphenol hydroxylase-like FAD-dependent oxidoreductase
VTRPVSITLPGSLIHTGVTVEAMVAGHSGGDRLDGNRVGIIGGSIAGCAAAIVLRRADCEVTVFERSAGLLRDRGHGVGLSDEARAELVNEDLIDADLPARRVTERSWFARDGDAPLGRLLWQQSFSATMYNWGMLWANLRSRVADADYRDGTPVTRIEPDADGVTPHCDGGVAERFDLVLGADGYRSVIRAAVDPAAEPTYSGYVLWRGGYPAAELPPPVPDVLRRQTVTMTYPGGHGLMMIIPTPGTAGFQIYWAGYYQPAQPVRPGIDHFAARICPVWTRYCRSIFRRTGPRPSPRPDTTRHHNCPSGARYADLELHRTADRVDRRRGHRGAAAHRQRCGQSCAGCPGAGPPSPPTRRLGDGAGRLRRGSPPGRHRTGRSRPAHR